MIEKKCEPSPIGWNVATATTNLPNVQHRETTFSLFDLLL
jgi:hypothetical protein